MEEKQKEFNSKAQRIRRFKFDLAESGLSNINAASPENAIKIGRRKIQNLNQEINIHKTINNPGLSFDDRKRNVYANRVGRTMKSLNLGKPTANNKIKSIPRINKKEK